MEVRKGYKLTEVGVIPDDWGAPKLGKIGPFSKGQGIRKDSAQSGNVPCVRYGELYTHHNDIVRRFYSFISKEVSKTSKRLRKGDILFAGSGETKEEIGKCAAFVDEGEVFAGGDIVILSPLKADSVFLGYCLNAPVVSKQKASKGQGDAVVHISASNLKNIFIPLPPTKEEQTAIAQALSDTDSLIAALEKLITKKSAIKQGTMQLLLTGKKRLPGFSRKWATKQLKQVAPLQRGFDLPTTQIREGIFPVVYSNGICNFHDEYMVKGPGVVTGRSGTIGKISFVKGDYWPHNTTLWVTSFKGNFPLFVFYLFSTIKFEKFGTGSGVPTLNRNDVHEHKVSIPSDIEEQEAIAQVLTDMDNEITGLEEKLDKYEAIKAGMMQQLLTGKIRLVKL